MIHSDPGLSVWGIGDMKPGTNIKGPMRLPARVKVVKPIQEDLWCSLQTPHLSASQLKNSHGPGLRSSEENPSKEVSKVGKNLPTFLPKVKSDEPRIKKMDRMTGQCFSVDVAL